MTAPTEMPPAHVARVTNMEVGELIGLSHSSVSRLRSGERGTSTPVMLRIEEKLQWDLRDQLRRREDGSYAAELEAKLLAWKSAQLAARG